VLNGQRQAARAGARDVAPILLGVIPFGLVVGVAGAELGGLLTATAFSLVVFAGASQLAAIGLLAAGSPLWVVIGTGVVINLRMLLYSASLAPHVATAPRWQRGVMAYLLTDQAYALTLGKLPQVGAEAGTGARTVAYFLGAGVPLWVTWQTTTVLGALGAGALPEIVPLGLALPLVFLVLLPDSVTDRPGATAALVAAGVSVAAAGLPANAALPTAIVTGVGAGWLRQRRLGS
jgi:predicted branched-subunit amino acid permease